MTLNYHKLFLAGISAIILTAYPIILAASPILTTSTERGAVTNLPIPRFVSMKAKEGNVRRGPGLTYRIDWVFKHTNTPLLVTAEYSHWRRVQDKDGLGGWIHYALLSGVRTVIANAPNIVLRLKPNLQAAPAAYAEEGAIGYLKECLPKWCEISVDGYGGWALKSDLWGVWDEEVRD